MRRNCPIFGPVCLLALAIAISFNRPANAAGAWRTYRGAWFKIAYPPGFTVRPSLKGATGPGFDSAFFVSPDRKVEFYVYSPQWSGSANDIALNPRTEHLVSRRQSTAKGRTTTWLTYAARNGSYTRSVLTRTDMSTTLVFGVKYTNAKAYSRYRRDYMTFKKSLVQYAD